MSDEEIGLAISIDDPEGGMILRWVVVAECIDPDGQESFRMLRSDGMATWTQMGLLDYGASIVRGGLAQCGCDE
jgi:hypothetical protein